MGCGAKGWLGVHSYLIQLGRLEVGQVVVRLGDDGSVERGEAPGGVASRKGCIGPAWTVEALPLGHVIHLPKDADEHAALRPVAVERPQLFQREVAPLHGGQPGLLGSRRGNYEGREEGHFFQLFFTMKVSSRVGLPVSLCKILYKRNRIASKSARLTGLEMRSYQSFSVQLCLKRNNVIGQLAKIVMTIDNSLGSFRLSCSISREKFFFHFCCHVIFCHVLD